MGSGSIRSFDAVASCPQCSSAAHWKDLAAGIYASPGAARAHTQSVCTIYQQAESRGPRAWPRHDMQAVLLSWLGPADQTGRHTKVPTRPDPGPNVTTMVCSKSGGFLLGRVACPVRGTSWSESDRPGAMGLCARPTAVSSAARGQCQPFEPTSSVAPFGRLSGCCLQCAPSRRYPIDQEVSPADRLEQFQTCAAQSSAPLRGAGQSD